MAQPAIELGQDGAPEEQHRSRLPHAVRTLGRRITNRLARPYLDELNARLDALAVQVKAQYGLNARLDALEAEMRDQLRRTRAVLRGVYEEEPANRRRLYELRRDPDYERAFTEDEPLVSFVIPTHSSPETLRDLTLPSILGQTYANLEVIVVGDGATAETRDAVAQLDDPRLRYHARNLQGPYPDDPVGHWFVAGTPAYNEGVSLAQGRWIAPMGDDDAVRPDHTEALVKAAQEHRYELCYGRSLWRFPGGETMENGEFPPRLGQFLLQTTIYHSGLRFIEQQLVDAIYEEPNDWALCRRMLAAGVRCGMIDRILVDKYERRRTAAEWRSGKPAEVR
jgi:Glycosyl transferase family 2